MRVVRHAPPELEPTATWGNNDVNCPKVAAKRPTGSNGLILETNVTSLPFKPKVGVLTDEATPTPSMYWPSEAIADSPAASLMIIARKLDELLVLILTVNVTLPDPSICGPMKSPSNTAPDTPG